MNSLSTSSSSHFQWTWDLKASPDQLWPFLSDTNQFNRDLHLPEIETLSYSGPETHFWVKRMRLKSPIRVEWDEFPFEWIRPHHFGIERIYQQGPFKSLIMRARLEKKPAGGTQLFYEIWITPRNFLGNLIIQKEIGKKFPEKVKALLQRYDKLAAGTPEPETGAIKDYLEKFNSPRLEKFAETSELARKLSFWLWTSPEETLARIRPFLLADSWNIPRRELLQLFLQAVKDGILDFQWEVICPHCRGSEKPLKNLGEIKNQDYCQNCRLHFTVNFDKLVELTFRPNPAIRKITQKIFCTGGPGASPHIAAQILLNSGEEKSAALRLSEGVHILRVERSPAQTVVETTAAGAKQSGVVINSKSMCTDSSWWGQEINLNLKNLSDKRALLKIEAISWASNRVSARDALHIPLFRDLFSTQCLRSGERISFGQLTFVFTDLKNSTSLYQEVGDPAAFERVINHFDVLRDAIRAHEGVLVKTIGDAVMAVFTQPAQALLAVSSAQRYLNSPDRRHPLLLKAGIHHGPALAVTLNERLDYFGTSVNIAARLVSLSSGQDIVFSSVTAEDPQVKLLINTPSPLDRFETFQTTIKGFGEENFSLVRFTPSCGRKE